MPPMREFSPQTKFVVSIGTALAVVGAAGAAAWRAQGTLTEIRDSVREVKDKVATLEQATSDRFDAMEVLMADRFTKTAAAEWALRFQLLNPTTVVPDPRQPDKMLKP